MTISQDISTHSPDPNSLFARRKVFSRESKADYLTGIKEIESRKLNICHANKGSGGGGGGSSPTEKSTFTNTQLLSQAKNMLEEKVDTGRMGADGKPIQRPKYTQEQFDDWLISMLPNNEEGRKAFNDIISMLGNIKYWDTSDPNMVSQESYRRGNHGVLK